MKKMLKVTLFSGLLTLFRMASGFMIAKVVAIYTGPTGIAMLGQIQSLFNAFNGVVAAPSGNGLVRYTAEYQSSDEPILGFEACAPWWKAALKWTLMLLAGVIPIICIFAKPLAFLAFGNEQYFWLVVIMALTLPLSVANTLISSVVNGQHQYRRFVTLGILSVIIATVVMMVLVINMQLNGAMISAAIFMSISGLVMLIASIQQPWFRFKYWWGTTAHSKMSDIGGYVLMAITTAVTTPIAMLMVRNILIEQVGWEQTGHFQAVYKISEVYLGVITIALSTYFLPKLSSLQGVDAILKEIQTTAKIVMPIVMLMAIMVYLFRDVAISLLFTEDFRSANNLFAIQLVGDVFKILSWIYAYPMLSRGATKWFMATEIVFSISLVLLSYFFIGRYGVQGANMAYALNYFIYLIFLYINVRIFSR